MTSGLNILKNYLSLMLEGRIDDVREKYPEIEEDVWQQLVASQPTGSNNKYLEWCAAQLDDGFSIEVVIQTIRLFNGNVNRLKQKDIYQYKDVGEVEKAIDELPTKSSSEKKQLRSETDKIYEDEAWLVLRPWTQEASCKYGSSTKWCISATAGRNYFPSYSSSNNKFYFVIDKREGKPKSPDSKYAIAIISSDEDNLKHVQVYNAQDKLVKLPVVAATVGDKWPEIWEKIKRHVKANPITREVEESRRAVEEDIKNFMSGREVSDHVLKKIAQTGTLTTPLVLAIIKYFDDKPFAKSWSGDRRPDIVYMLSDRHRELQPEASSKLAEWLFTMKQVFSPKDKQDAYWGGDYTLEKLLSNAHLTTELFNNIIESKDELSISSIYENQFLPIDLRKQIEESFQSMNSRSVKRKIYWELIKSGRITPQQFAQAIANDGDESYTSVTSMILVHPEVVNMPPEMIRMLNIRDELRFYPLLRINNVPSDFVVDTLIKLINANKISKGHKFYQMLRTVNLETNDAEKLWANNKDINIRVSLLQNPSIGQENVSKFSKSANSAFRFAVAHNPITPENDLDQLSNDESVSTRSAIAANTNTPVKTLVKLSSDEADVVRASIAGNTKTPINVIQLLKKDNSQIVRKTASKTLRDYGLKATTESLLRSTIRALINEAIVDDTEQIDIMTPHWSDLKYGSDVSMRDFVAIFLLQNNGHATREEISNAYQNWTRRSGSKEIWKSDPNEIYRGIAASGKGWYWAPPGNNKDAVFRLTPAGASAALGVLKKPSINQDLEQEQGIINSVNSATAVPGRTYFIPRDDAGEDVTEYKDGELSRIKVETDYDGNIIFNNGKVKKTTRSMFGRRGRNVKRVFAYTSPSGENKYFETIPRVGVKINDPVKFIKPMYGYSSRQGSEKVKAIVKHEKTGKYLLMDFPFWLVPGGDVPATREKVPQLPVKKTPLGPPPKAPKASTSPAQPTAQSGPRGPKAGYKIYGRKGGAPAHTRLKGQAYAAPADTKFAPGEQAEVQVADDGKLKVKKIGGDHNQLWSPIDG